MRKIFWGISTLFLLSLTSCLDESVYEKETVYKEDILNYFDALMVSTKGEFNDEISEFKNSINFRKVETYDLRTTEKIISAEITSLNSFQDAERVKAIFFLNNGKIVRSNIVTFDHEMHFDKHDDIIVSILNMDASTQIYTGRMTVYNAFQKLLMYNIYESGKLVENAMARIDAGANPTSGKTNGCTNWYLITTTYYSDGSTTTTTEYLYTSCSGGNCEEQASRGSKINCGGGPWTGGAGSPAGINPSFPSLPANGDVYEFTNANGEYTKYQFDSQKGIWVVIERILPPITIILEPENYPFLMIQWPVHGQIVFGTDNFIYTYDGGSGNWEGVYCIQNQLTNPCLFSVAAHVLDPNVTSTYNGLIQQVFNSSDKVNWILIEGSINGAAQTPPDLTNDGIFTVITTLDPADLTNKSREYIASTIYHEAFHALMHKYTGAFTYTPTEHHYQMITNFIVDISEALQEAYPNLSTIEAKALIAKQIYEFHGPVRSQILLRIGLTEDQINAALIKFSGNGPGTTGC
ncbi:hypothetical protein SanaruYs_11690 [Chryseotalea sanaruensis]|uniref:Uncharacterized protein n=1 Tax=Chryseotalea sanaruensis TaxID=2482724 RepID=A0A401U7T2_9BACT|nr:hypothetical protein [Chryseotalea sanaruensis]GCC50950.1 hypothetical protein SanaruYs_11690 [Chryseotalea sanaruensis]